MKTRIKNHFENGIAVRKAIHEQMSDTIIAAAEHIAEAIRNDCKLMVCGNGGSAADAQHIVAEFVSSLDHTRPRRAFPAIALTTDTSILTACANDFGYEHVFARQVEALAKTGDVLLAISTSGNSRNVVRAVSMAAQRGVSCIALTGKSGGELKSSCHLTLAVPSENTQIIQESHLAIEHVLCDLVEGLLCCR